MKTVGSINQRLVTLAVVIIAGLVSNTACSPKTSKMTTKEPSTAVDTPGGESESPPEAIALPLIDGVTDEEHRIFVSSSVMNGAIGGIEGADKICSEISKKIGLKRNYRAILSTTESNASERIEIRGPVYVFDSSKRYLVSDALTFWSDQHEAPISYNQEGQLVDEYVDVWSGTSADGRLASEQTCENWTSSEAGVIGGSGLSTEKDGKWISAETITCDKALRLYCISQ